MSITFRCGHPRDEANSVRVGWYKGAVPAMACKVCQRESNKQSMRRLREARDQEPTPWIVAASNGWRGAR